MVSGDFVAFIKYQKPTIDLGKPSIKARYNVQIQV